MTGLLIFLAIAAAMAYAIWWWFHPRVFMRNTERPYLVVLYSRAKSYGPNAKGTCTACGWVSGEYWMSMDGITSYILPDLKGHHCPDLDEASKPKEWETL